MFKSSMRYYLTLSHKGSCQQLWQGEGVIEIFHDGKTFHGLPQMHREILSPLEHLNTFCPPPHSWLGYQLIKIVQNGGTQAISEILHIKYWIVCCIETYLINIYHMSKCSKCNWNRYIEILCMWNVHLYLNRLCTNNVILMSWHLMAIYLLLLNYWLFSVQFSYHI